MLHLREQDGLQYAAIAERLNRTLKGVTSCYDGIVRRGQRVQIDRHYWRPEQDRELLRLSREGTDIEHIALRFERRADVCQARLHALRDLMINRRRNFEGHVDTC